MFAVRTYDFFCGSCFIPVSIDGLAFSLLVFWDGVGGTQIEQLDGIRQFGDLAATHAPDEHVRYKV